MVRQLLRGGVSGAGRQVLPLTARAPRGAGVIWIQKKLGIEADGVYGAETNRAVREFQKNAGIAADGIFGRETNRAMGDNKGGLLPW